MANLCSLNGARIVENMLDLIYNHFVVFLALAIPISFSISNPVLFAKCLSMHKHHSVFLYFILCKFFSETRFRNSRLLAFYSTKLPSNCPIFPIFHHFFICSLYSFFCIIFHKIKIRRKPPKAELGHIATDTGKSWIKIVGR